MTISIAKNNWVRSAACLLSLGLASGVAAAPEWVERWNSFAQFVSKFLTTLNPTVHIHLAVLKLFRKKSLSD